MYEKTQYAPPNNMESEGILAMVDSQLHRAPNAQVDVISSKVKLAKNNTIGWLSHMSPAEQRKIIRSAVQQRKNVTKKLKERKRRNQQIAKQRLYELVLKKESKKTKEMEKRVAKFFTSGKVTVADLESDFSSISPEVLQLTAELCNDPENIIGKEFTHLWYDKEKCNVEVYTGSVLEYTAGKNGNGKFIMEYWFADCPEESHESVLKHKEVVSDLLLGDLLFH